MTSYEEETIMKLLFDKIKVQYSLYYLGYIASIEREEFKKALSHMDFVPTLGFFDDFPLKIAFTEEQCLDEDEAKDAYIYVFEKYLEYANALSSVGDPL